LVKERIIVLTKTYPELSRKHGPLVCVAGVNEYKEWRRLYPIPLKIWVDNKYEDIRFSKWDIIEVEVSEKPPSHDRRFESRRVKEWKNIRIVDHIKSWEARLAIIKELLDPDIETIIESNRSLGVIKPRKVQNFLIKPRQRLKDEAEKQVLEKMEEADSTITLLEYLEIGDKYLLPEVKEPDVKVEKLPWIGYTFYCQNPHCKGHEMMVIDWEAQELFRRYKTLPPVKEKLFTWMLKDRDLYFIIGNTWKWKKSFMIIGLFYPPKGTYAIMPLWSFFKKKPRQRTLFNNSTQ